MKRIFLSMIVSIFVLTGCTSNNQKIINIEQLSKDIIEKVEFDDSLNKIDSKMIIKIYNIDNADHCIAYIGSGATAEEFAAFEFNTQEQANDAYKKIQERIEQQIQDYSTYMPQEVARLKQAIIRKEGIYVIYCVSADQKAKEIIDNYL